MTLMEMMITLGLLTVIFGIGADLLQDAFKVLREQNYKGQANQAIQLAFNRICCEVREATNLNSAGSNLLELELENPNYATAVPIPYSDPYNSNNLVVVSYTTDGQGSLIRQSHPKSGGATVTQNLVQGIQGLSCSNTSYGAVNITLSINDLNLGIRSLNTVVYAMGSIQ